MIDRGTRRWCVAGAVLGSIVAGLGFLIGERAIAVTAFAAVMIFLLLISS